MFIFAYIRSKTASIQKENNKDEFRKKCLALNTHVISRIPRIQYIDQNRWKGALRTFYGNYHEVLTKYGGCPMILDEHDKELLVHFNNKKVQLYKNCRRKEHLSQFPTKKCNILESETFQGINTCLVSDIILREEKTPEKLNEVSKESESEYNARESAKPQNQDLSQGEESPKAEASPLEISPHQTETESSISRDGTTESEVTAPSQSVELKITTDNNYVDSKREESPRLQPSIPEDSGALPNPKIISTHTVSPNFGLISTDHSSHSTTTVRINKSVKKKKKGKKKTNELFENSNTIALGGKSEFLTHDNLEHPIYDDEEIIKKIKINELTKNVYLSKRKKDRSKTIIEVHMEVLEECRNEDWENNKEAFLKICLDEFTKKDYRTYPNLTYNDLITENIKSSNDIEKQNILWNKWVERHRYLFAKLKKEDWESFLDISINEWKTKKYSGNKQEITENTIEYINSDIENKRNNKFHTHIGKDGFRNEIEDWIGEDNLYASSIINNGTVEKSIDIAEKHIS
ncbi:STP1 protein [Plasmodium malariae]|uniref:STP1 protein n=1 Tax=Plasmodium malariae TaxID=5858 RepID=A0A1D3JGS5_PLAMA|nr:STP1 protein [Plasmodium malariae]SBT85433.1 STP1 protein [Plasmodium malariae]